MSDKIQLLEQLNNSKNNFMLGLAAWGLFQVEKTYPILDELIIEMERHTEGRRIIQFAQVANAFRNEPEIGQVRIDEFHKMNFRAFLTEPFELVQAHCEKHRLKHKIKGESWYDFSRLIRNAISHTGSLNFYFSRQDVKLLEAGPVSWRHRQLTLELNGSPIGDHIIDQFDALDLWGDIHTSVTHVL